MVAVRVVHQIAFGSHGHIYAEAVDCYVVFGEDGGRRDGQMLQGLLAHAVGHHVREIACGSHRGDVEYPRAAALGQIRASQLGGDQRSCDIDVHYQLEPLGGEVKIAGEGDGRVVDEHVYAAEL